MAAARARLAIWRKPAAPSAQRIIVVLIVAPRPKDIVFINAKTAVDSVALATPVYWVFLAHHPQDVILIRAPVAWAMLEYLAAPAVR